MSLYQRGETWWLDVTVNGQRIRESTGHTDKRKAQEVHDSVKHSAKQLKESGKTLNDALKVWLTARERSVNDKSSIKTFLKSYPNRPLSQIDTHDILDATTHYSAGNYNRTTNIIRAALNMAAARGWCAPIKVDRRKAPPNKLRFLSKKEWECLQKELPEHVLALVTFALATGLRQANVLYLRWSEVNLAEKMAWVDSTETKSRKSLSIPLNETALSVLRSQTGNHKEFVFTYKGNPIKSVKKAWNNALVRAKIDVVTRQDKNGKDYITSSFRFHDLRHTWASWHVQNGTPLAVLKELGGWSDINMVMRYAHLSPEHLRKYANNSVP